MIIMRQAARPSSRPHARVRGARRGGEWCNLALLLSSGLALRHHALASDRKSVPA